MEKQEILGNASLMECAADLLADTDEMFESLDISALPADDGPFHTVIVRALKEYYEYTCEGVPKTLAYVAALEAHMTPDKAKAIRSGLDGEPLMYDPASVMKEIKGLKDQVKGLTDEQSELQGTVEEASEAAASAKSAVDTSGVEGVDLSDMQDTIERFEEFVQNVDLDDLADKTMVDDLEGKVDDNEARIEDNEDALKKLCPVKKTKADKALLQELVGVLEAQDGEDEDDKDNDELAAKIIAMVRGAS